ncbi:hypothetical protein HHL23_09325 [Chryseobacterium sp. RP-3-3]|uniref:YopX protein domain-containing protein n=1 Tax=Chryseobacterium antibioticum TaxID=2728847 RepID=A0A7Y0AMF2_9FLAO|nr:YopX family protein [Chryseobacterium antibioticum]NML70000.1 hypothetical protein [Chryseobacterium antibioticum]
MNREIKFRGQRVDNSEWVFGFYAGAPGTSCVNILTYENLQYTGDYCCHEVLSESVGQFTGLIDKNGTFIYEGDILKTYQIFSLDNIGLDSFNVIVRWNMNCWLANGIIGEKQAEISEVIGNIHSNPELLK